MLREAGMPGVTSVCTLTRTEGSTTERSEGDQGSPLSMGDTDPEGEGRMPRVGPTSQRGAAAS